MRYALVGSVAALVAGVALIAWSIVEQGASLYLVVFVPVVSGSSLSFLLGVALLLVGFFTLPWALDARGEAAVPAPSPPAAAPSSPEPSGGVGGVVLLGPVPIVFGSWKGVSRRTRWWLALGGAIVFTVGLLVFVLVLR